MLAGEKHLTSRAYLSKHLAVLECTAAKWAPHNSDASNSGGSSSDLDCTSFARVGGRAWRWKERRLPWSLTFGGKMCFFWADNIRRGLERERELGWWGWRVEEAVMSQWMANGRFLADDWPISDFSVSIALLRRLMCGSYEFHLKRKEAVWVIWRILSVILRGYLRGYLWGNPMDNQSD